MEGQAKVRVQLKESGEEGGERRAKRSEAVLGSTECVNGRAWSGGQDASGQQHGSGVGMECG